LDDVKLRVGSMEAVIANGHFNRAEQRLDMGQIVAWIIAAATTVGLVLAVLHK
jgi:hypothetical protein